MSMGKGMARGKDTTNNRDGIFEQQMSSVRKLLKAGSCLDRVTQRETEQ
jgi:hypothetical protein